MTRQSPIGTRDARRGAGVRIKVFLAVLMAAQVGCYQQEKAEGVGSKVTPRAQPVATRYSRGATSPRGASFPTMAGIAGPPNGRRCSTGSDCIILSMNPIRTPRDGFSIISTAFAGFSRNWKVNRRATGPSRVRGLRRRSPRALPPPNHRRRPALPPLPVLRERAAVRVIWNVAPRWCSSSDDRAAVFRSCR